MSFSSDIKSRLCKTEFDCAGCRTAELAGMLRFTGAAGKGEVKFLTESEDVVKRICGSICEVFGINAEFVKRARSYMIVINDINSVENINEYLEQENLMPFTCCSASFVRGAFLGGGSISDPAKSYHMEFSTKNTDEAQLLCDILAKEGFGAKITHRKSKEIVYIKECEQIADILGYIGADNGALEMFTIQVEKQMRNDINRRVNCENANMDKSAKASSKHMQAIKTIKKSGTWEKLPEVLREIGNLREENPDVSLKELGEMTNPPIGKSGVNHRLNRIIEIAEGMDKNNG